jgi:ABC-2 type transport system ATP-binding protein
MNDNVQGTTAEPAFELRSVTRRFKETVALDRLSLRVEPGQIVGLIGRNGSGKTTFLRHVVGLQLPSAGEVRTLGVPSERLGSSELGRIGMVHQEIELPGWMRVERMLRYVASYHARWSMDREARLIEELEIDPAAKVGTLTPGNLQKVALVLAVCPRPELLLLDEPVSALDPIVRERLLSFLIELLREDGSTIVISSHVLRDVERVVDWIVCLERGRVIADVAMDELRERYAEWRLVSTNGALPARFDEPFVLHQHGDERSARLEVRRSGAGIDALAFGARHHALVEERPMDLERIFPLLLAEAQK